MRKKKLKMPRRIREAGKMLQDAEEIIEMANLYVKAGLEELKKYVKEENKKGR